VIYYLIDSAKKTKLWEKAIRKPNAERSYEAPTERFGYGKRRSERI
tara:strand:- start:114 stop:251 length:138 start_codon:yes stop_codon:yes gene_type:complete